MSTVAEQLILARKAQNLTVNQVAEVIKMQQKVLKATESARETRTKEVFDDKP